MKSSFVLNNVVNLSGLEDRVFSLDPSSINVFVSLLASSNFSAESRRSLEGSLRSQERSYDVFYRDFVSSLKSVVDGLVEQKTQFPECRDELESKFKLVEFRDVRALLCEKYDCEWSRFFELDDISLNFLRSDVSYFKKNSVVNFFYDKGSEVLFSYRVKDVESRRSKFLVEWSKSVEIAGLDTVLSFSESLVNERRDVFSFWREYANFCFDLGCESLGSDCDVSQRNKAVERGDNMLKYFISDVLGVTVCVLNAKRAESVESKLRSSLSRVDFDGSSLIRSRIKDHEDRRVVGRPGGFHLNLFASPAFLSIPFELKVLKPVDLIYHFVGENNFTKYELLGKKVHRKFFD